MNRISNWQTAVLCAAVAGAACYLASAKQPGGSAGPATEALPMELFGTMGKEAKLVPGKEMTLLEQGGAGTLTHMWFGGSWPGFADTHVRVYVDGEEKPRNRHGHVPRPRCGLEERSGALG